MRAPKSTVEKARALRRALTFPEILLWQLLRGGRDDKRDAWLAAQGIHVLRFPARDLLTDDGRASVLATIAASLVAPSTAFQAVPPPPVSRGGIASKDLRFIDDR